MDSQGLAGIKKIVVKHHSEAVNRYLEGGWKVICVTSGREDDGHPLVRYDLAWFGDDAPFEPVAK